MSQKPDPLMTPAKYAELEKKLEKLKRQHPAAAAEVSRLAELGDFSENAEYQLAKGKLRGMLAAMARLEYELHNAQIIETWPGAQHVAIGSRVRVRDGDTEREYSILGSSEANPSQGIISYSSPLGNILLGHAEGDTVELRVASKTKKLIIVKII